jgi:hypothetical protein
MALRIIDLDIDESLSADTRVSEIGWVLQPAIETEFVYFSKDRMDKKSLKKIQDYLLEYQPNSLPPYVNYATGDTKDNMLVKPVLFVEKQPGESVDEYISRCVAHHIKNEGMESDQAYAICKSESEEFYRGQRVSFDYDNTLTTARGYGLALHEKFLGSELYIVSARNNKRSMLSIADKLGIPHNRVFATGSNTAKIQKIKDLNILKHYDDNKEVISKLGRRGVQFSCPCLDEISDTGQEIFNIMEEYNLVGFIDGQPVFSTPDEAEDYGELLGCNGHHTHTDENGNEVYMACQVHPEKVEEDFSLDEYSEEELETIKLLKFLSDTDYEKFEAVVGSLRGATEQEIYKRNHKTPTIYFQYERVLSGSPDRDFCSSIENRYFRRLEIDLLRDMNTEFGHEKQPYSKWLYKGGPNCVHAWHKYLFQGKNKTDQGMAEGKAGMAPKSLPNNGYYSPETKRKSEVAYIISQQNMSKQIFKADNDQRLIYTPLMIPNILIPRNDDGDIYFVRFRPEVIKKIRDKFMIEGRLRENNYEHSDQKFNDMVMVESWIVEGLNDKAYELGFTQEQVPIGSWMGGYKVLESEEGDVIWNDYIKSGKVKGASVEGEFLLKFFKQDFSKEDIILDEIIKILNQVEL